MATSEVSILWVVLFTEYNRNFTADYQLWQYTLLESRLESRLHHVFPIHRTLSNWLEVTRCPYHNVCTHSCILFTLCSTLYRTSLCSTLSSQSISNINLTVYCTRFLAVYSIHTQNRFQHSSMQREPAPFSYGRNWLENCPGYRSVSQAVRERGGGVSH